MKRGDEEKERETRPCPETTRDTIPCLDPNSYIN